MGKLGPERQAPEAAGRLPMDAIRSEWSESVLAAVADGLLICPWNLVEQHARVRELVRKYADPTLDTAT